MKELNLTNVEHSEIKWHVDCFPDGEVSLVIEDELDHKIDYVQLKTRITCANDLFVLLQATDILNRHGITFDLYISYLMSMRMDRVMDWNRPFSLKIVANLIKTCGSRHIYVLEPHSERTLSELGAEPWITKSDWRRKLEMSKRTYNNTNILVFPDAGASERYGKNIPAACFTKKRNIETGQIIGLVPSSDEDESIIKGAETIMIIDDLCDAGGTFCGIAKYIREINPDVQLEIFVTHIVNQKGIENLTKTFDRVIFTNSYSDWRGLTDSPKIEVLEVI